MGKVWRCERCGESPSELINRNGKRYCSGCSNKIKVEEAMQHESYVTGLMVNAKHLKEAMK